ncbi:hypothetical protein PR202_ga29707 [Eleusine coracana subsp. coracana]|uniref:Uncharacterized protein n=1 Tax=Eleusine coracana subsp. coracana TaxID=191504 RepID=A0AAV5DMA9_ELECO|nr:hypothetical protein QOZ80_7AG0570540 [Eleusine coracana subsp. coracana]GJN11509.1 hypothetical protein PR202_ga29707 [Eleusine coracana subsp. coracana]
MGRRHLLAAVAATIVAVAFLAPHAAGYPWPMCGTTNNFAPNSTFQTNLNRIAATLPNATASSRDLYATARAGTVPEQVWAMALCRSDINATECRTCITQAFVDAQTSCVFFRDATIYYNPCMLHYSDVHILPDDDTGPTTDFHPIINHGNVTSDPERFNEILTALVNATADYAAFNSTKRFATGEADFNQEFPKVYTVAQCPPDQPPERCRKCLAGIIRDTLPAFLGHIGGRVLWVNCTYRFETASFYNGQPIVRLASPSSGAPAPAPAVEEPATSGGGGRKYHVPGVVLAVVLAVLAVFNLLVACLCFWRRRGRTAEAKKPYPKYSTEAEDAEMVESLMIDVSTLRAATGDFNDSNKLGEGGFGALYKGVLPGGEEIAVKRLSDSSKQGDDELKNELALVAKLKHKNLVRLVGVCLDEQERLLVYEYVPNRSLDLILFGSDENDEERREQLDWEQRYRIINGIARGLQYLHEDSQLRVIHRDLKASNILLDANMNPKISDFGLARIFTRDQTQAVTNTIAGTCGYMAPEYVMRGNYSVKSDAFSFGVIVLEIVTGRKNNDSYNSKQSGDLLNTVFEHWDAGTVMELVDPSMKGSFPEGDLLRCFHVGLLCVQGDPAARPMMSSVVMMLGTDTITLHAPSKPGVFARNNGTDMTVSTVSLQG